MVVVDLDAVNNDVLTLLASDPGAITMLELELVAGWIRYRVGPAEAGHGSWLLALVRQKA